LETKAAVHKEQGHLNISDGPVLFLGIAFGKISVYAVRFGLRAFKELHQSAASAK
jgi:hypothetical protein